MIPYVIQNPENPKILCHHCYIIQRLVALLVTAYHHIIICGTMFNKLYRYGL
jgi:hypothetical protein